MPNLVFNSTKSRLFDRTLDLTAGVFYVHLVTTAPTNPAILTVSQLVLAAGGNYAPVVVANTRFTSNNNAVQWLFDNPTWNNLTTNNSDTVKGMVACKRAGASPQPTDVVITYNELGAPYVPNGATFTIQIPAAGVLVGA